MYINDFISNHISEEKIKKWEGNNILIVADTGLGKTTFVGGKLYDYAKSINKRILYLCNRRLVKEQVKTDFQGKEIDCCTYQYFENNIEEIDKYLTANYILVLDEVHYFGTDSSFNPKNQLIYEKLISSSNEKIFMTATPECLYIRKDYFQYEYEYKRNLQDYIEKYYCFNSYEGLVNLLGHIPVSEKVLFVSTNIDKIENLADKFKKNASVLVANSPKNREIYKEYNCKAVSEEIVDNERFSSKLLLATPCIDNGVSLKMEELKHIIIDVVNPVTVKQIIGRKRFLNENDKINLYISSWHNGLIQGRLNAKTKLFDMLDFWDSNSKDGFIHKYQMEQYDNRLFYLDTESGQELLKVNQCYRGVLEYEKKYTNEILAQPISEGKGYLMYVCQYLGIPLNDFISIEYTYDYEIIKNFSTAHNGEKLYSCSEQYNELKDIFKNKLLNYKEKTVGKLNIEKYIKSFNSKQDYYFSFESRNETKGENRGKQYWLITCDELNTTDIFPFDSA